MTIISLLGTRIINFCTLLLILIRMTLAKSHLSPECNPQISIVDMKLTIAIYNQHTYPITRLKYLTLECVEDCNSYNPDQTRIAFVCICIDK